MWPFDGIFRKKPEAEGQHYSPFAVYWDSDEKLASYIDDLREVFMALKSSTPEIRHSMQEISKRKRVALNKMGALALG